MTNKNDNKISYMSSLTVQNKVQWGGGIYIF